MNIKNKKKILILEKNSSAGKKLLISGSGQCNFTHTGNIENFFSHYGKNNKFLIPALKEFTNQDLIDFFKKNNLKILIDKNNKVFPDSGRAIDILDILLSKTKENKVQIQYNSEIIKIELYDNNFKIITSDQELFSNKLLISTGGKSYPTTGSTGDGYIFAKNLGHTIIPPKPALTPVIIENYKFSSISGVSLRKIKLKLYRDYQKIAENSDDILFTHTGLSGPGILDISRYIISDDILKINLININQDIFRDEFIKSTEHDGNMSIKKFLKNFNLPESLIKIILFESNISENEKLSNISKIQRINLINLFCEYNFKIKKTGGFNIAMVTTGGVNLKEVSMKTMESKLVKNLYFAGEVLDYDGDTGGYNLQAAFSTGFLAAKNLSI